MDQIRSRIGPDAQPACAFTLENCRTVRVEGIHESSAIFMRLLLCFCRPQIALLAITNKACVQQVGRIVYESRVFRPRFGTEMIQLHQTFAADLFLMNITIGAPKEAVLSDFLPIMGVLCIVVPVLFL